LVVAAKTGLMRRAVSFGLRGELVSRKRKCPDDVPNV